MEAPAIGERYRGPEAPSGYLLRQAWNAFSGAIDAALREHGLKGARFAGLTVVLRLRRCSRPAGTHGGPFRGIDRALARSRLVLRESRACLQHDPAGEERARCH